MKSKLARAIISSILGGIAAGATQPLVSETLSTSSATATVEVTIAPVISVPPIVTPVIDPTPPPISPPVKDRPAFADGTEQALGGLRTLQEVARGPNGQLAYLEISILDAEHYWPLSQADRVVGPGGQEQDLLTFLNSTGLQKDIVRALDILAIGMASCEQERSGVLGQNIEESRAQDRAHQLISWIRQLKARSPRTQLYTVNLGRYQDPDCTGKTPYQTRLQRNVILVSVIYKENVADRETLRGLIKDHLTHSDGLGLEINRYSKPEFFLRLRS